MGTDKKILVELFFKFLQHFSYHEKVAVGEDEFAVVALCFDADELLKGDDIHPATGGDEHLLGGHGLS